MKDCPCKQRFNLGGGGHIHYVCTFYYNEAPDHSQVVAKTFIDNVFKLHILPSFVVSERYMIFTGNLLHDIFKALGVKQDMHPIIPLTDRRTERENWCLETYLRCMYLHNIKSGICGYLGGTTPTFALL